ncbi:hypothetical protein C0993_006527 [Termitomyces sp. T159_Od127]|nr:hypothetical protein C0993_006527 [Termitomyces sp. T159_Od127]
MSTDTTLNASASITTTTADIKALTNDLTRLDALLAKTELSEKEDVDVTELLKRLESAEGIAGKVEAKVDDVLAKLDEIIQGMNEQEIAKIENGTDAKVSSDTKTRVD